MDVYVGKKGARTNVDMTVTRASVRHLTRKAEEHRHKLYMDNVLSSPDLFDDLTKKKINCRRAIRPNRKGMIQDLTAMEQLSQMRWYFIRD
jgi:hypothetical protein